MHPSFDPSFVNNHIISLYEECTVIDLSFSSTDWSIGISSLLLIRAALSWAPLYYLWSKLLGVKITGWKVCTCVIFINTIKLPSIIVPVYSCKSRIWGLLFAKITMHKKYLFHSLFLTKGEFEYFYMFEQHMWVACLVGCLYLFAHFFHIRPIALNFLGTALIFSNQCLAIMQILSQVFCFDLACWGALSIRRCFSFSVS